MTEILVVFGTGARLRVELRPDMTPSVRGLLESLPFKTKAQTWGDEVYFSVPFHASREEDSRMEMVIGDVAFWPDGDAIAVFFGPTPASLGSAPMAYSPCNILGRVKGDMTSLKTVRPGAEVEVLEV